MAIKELNATEPHTEKWLKWGNPCRSSGEIRFCKLSSVAKKKNTFLMAKVDFTLCIFYHNLKKTSQL